jgi:hypothetical protein
VGKSCASYEMSGKVGMIKIKQYFPRWFRYFLKNPHYWQKCKKIITINYHSHLKTHMYNLFEILRHLKPIKGRNYKLKFDLCTKVLCINYNLNLIYKIDSSCLEGRHWTERPRPVSAVLRKQPPIPEDLEATQGTASKMLFVFWRRVPENWSRPICFQLPWKLLTYIQNHFLYRFPNPKNTICNPFSHCLRKCLEVYYYISSKNCPLFFSNTKMHISRLSKFLLLYVQT